MDRMEYTSLEQIPLVLDADCIALGELIVICGVGKDDFAEA